MGSVEGSEREDRKLKVCLVGGKSESEEMKANTTNSSYS